MKRGLAFAGLVGATFPALAAAHVRQMKRLALAFALMVAGLLLVTGSAAAKTSKATFDVHVGDNFVPPLAEPSFAGTPRGDTVEVVLSGTFGKGTKDATGGGTFVHSHDGTTLATGTITLTRTIAFQSYGCGVAPDGSSLPPNFCGGRVLLGVHLVGHPAHNPSATVERDGTLEVNCQVHAPGVSPPPGTSEGIKLNAHGINFNRHVAGANLFVEH